MRLGPTYVNKLWPNKEPLINKPAARFFRRALRMRVGVADAKGCAEIQLHARVRGVYLKENYCVYKLW